MSRRVANDTAKRRVWGAVVGRDCYEQIADRPKRRLCTTTVQSDIEFNGSTKPKTSAYTQRTYQEETYHVWPEPNN